MMAGDRLCVASERMGASAECVSMGAQQRAFIQNRGEDGGERQRVPESLHKPLQLKLQGSIYIFNQIQVTQVFLKSLFWAFETEKYVASRSFTLCLFVTF